MSFFAVLLALVIEQLKPLPRNNWVYPGLLAWLGWAARNLDAGLRRHAWVVWGVATGLPCLVVLALFLALAHWSQLLALLFDVAVLYLTLGFRQFSHYFTDIRAALDAGDEREARRLLAEWKRIDASDLPRSELLRQVIEHALLAAHRHVFGVFFWFVLLSSLGLGPTGAVLYRLAVFAARHWSAPERAFDAPSNPLLMAVATQLFAWIDLVPSRLTAFGFAVVGNFEEAINAWRRDSALWSQANDGVILASASGAVGVRLAGADAPFARGDRSSGIDTGMGDLGPGDTAASTEQLPQAAHLQSVVGLVWRSVVLWMLLVALLTLANLVG